ncbi:hypothetical protein FHS60_000100 [Alloprevotella rava]|uniref:Uncharacterized protein n=1 Tax=Alloprevotella rava TaxID=671218 RepID=A0A7W5UCU8_9BACT|nr:hypothetical protein [Alloprevotella rava]
MFAKAQFKAKREHIRAMGDMLSDTVIMEFFLEHLFGINAFFV